MDHHKGAEAAITDHDVVPGYWGDQLVEQGQLGGAEMAGQGGENRPGGQAEEGHHPQPGKADAIVRRLGFGIGFSVRLGVRQGDRGALDEFAGTIL